MRNIVETYLGHVADHSVEHALACLAPDFILQFAGSGFSLTKAQAANALEWDVGANGRLRWSVIEESQTSVTVEGSEGNDFLDLVGIRPISFRSIYTVAPSGRISRQLHSVTWGDLSLEDAMAPLTAWAAQHEPQELNEIYPAGQMSYSGPMAARWVRLAQRWRSALSSREGSQDVGLST